MTELLERVTRGARNSDAGSALPIHATVLALLAPACQTGNWVAFYVDSTTGHWSSITTFSFK